MQQINLYQPHLRPQEQSFSARTIGRGSAVVALGMILLYVATEVHTHQLGHQVAQYQRQRDDGKKLVQDLMSALPANSKDAALAQDIVRLQSELQNKQQVVARLAQHDHGNTTGYSSHLEGLARQRLPQLWLTRIGLRQGGAAVELYGSTTLPEQVPQYLQRLAAEAAFHGVEFRQFSLTRSEKTPQQVDFVLLTSQQEPTP